MACSGRELQPSLERGRLGGDRSQADQPLSAPLLPLPLQLFLGLFARRALCRELDAQLAAPAQLHRDLPLELRDRLLESALLLLNGSQRLLTPRCLLEQPNALGLTLLEVSHSLLELHVRRARGRQGPLGGKELAIVVSAEVEREAAASLSVTAARRCALSRRRGGCQSLRHLEFLLAVKLESGFISGRAPLEFRLQMP